MNIVYEKIEQLCKNAGITCGKLCGEIGVRRSLLSDLKQGRKSSLSADTLAKIANYFDVSIDYLLGNTDKKKPLVNNDEELTEYLEELKNRKEMRMLFSISKSCTKEEVEQAVRIIEALHKRDSDE